MTNNVQPSPQMPVLPIIVLIGILSICAWWLRKHHAKVTLEFKWYDLWNGLYIRLPKAGEATRHLYWCPLWCVVFHISWPVNTMTLVDRLRQPGGQQKWAMLLDQNNAR